MLILYQDQFIWKIREEREWSRELITAGNNMPIRYGLYAYIIFLRRLVMKNKRFLVVLISLMLVCGFALVGCENGTTDEEQDDNPFIGTWELKDKDGTYSFIITNDSWTFKNNGEDDEKGTYTYQDSSITLVATHEWDSDTNKWTQIDEESFTLTLSQDKTELATKGISVYKKI
jgi:hypothetical protein